MQGLFTSACIKTGIIQPIMHKLTEMKLFVCVIGFVCCFLALLSEPAYYRVTRTAWKNGIFRVDKSTFTIVQFADLHFGEHEESDLKSTMVMRDILRMEQDTDLVVFSGDQVSGYVKPNPLDSLRMWSASLLAVNASGIPFATIFGNHDDQAFHTGHMIQYHCAQGLLAAVLFFGLLLASRRRFYWSGGLVALGLPVLIFVFMPSVTMRNSLLHYELAHFPALSVSREGPGTVSGLSNYVLQASHSNQTVLIFLLDTGGGRLEETFTDRQLEWVMSTARNRGNNLTAIAFAHIASEEFRDALSDTDRFACIGHNRTEQVIPAARENLPPMDTLSKAGVRAIFSGHDHRDSYCCIPRDAQVHQPAMCYGRHTGYGGYGDWMRGARVIQLDFSFGEPVIRTWLRMEDGRKRELVRLYPLG